MLHFMGFLDFVRKPQMEVKLRFTMAMALDAAAFVVGVLALSHYARASDHSPVNLVAKDVYELCRGDERSCTDFLIIMDDAYARMIARGMIKPGLICIPYTATVMQYKRIFVRYSEKHQDQMNKPAADVWLDSQIEAYPCHTKEAEQRK